MKEIVEKLKENRQVELAKELLESAGYTVSSKITESGDPSPELQDSISQSIAATLQDFGLSIDDAAQAVTAPFDELVYQSAKAIEEGSMKESKDTTEESTLNESALDQLWSLYDSSPAIADAIEKIADELGIGTDESPTEEEAKKILDAYKGEGNSLEVKSVDDMIHEIADAVEELGFVQHIETFSNARLMTNNKGFIITTKDGKEYQFALLGSF